MIFLFPWRKKDYDSDERKPLPMQEAPADLFFAEQKISNACATVALLNIVFNTPEGVERGEVGARKR